MTEYKICGEVLRFPRHQPVDGMKVEGGQEIYKLEEWMVWEIEPERAIHLLDGSNLQIAWRKVLLQVL